jgi:hypothetical protein
MSKRRQLLPAVDATSRNVINPFERLPDEVIRLILLIVMSDAIGLIEKARQRPHLWWPHRLPIATSAVITLFRLERIDKRLVRITNGCLAADTWPLLAKVVDPDGHWCCLAKRGQNSTLCRNLLYLWSERDVIHREIDTQTVTHNVTYRSPVRQQMTRGVISLKKLCHAKYPNAFAKNTILSQLKRHEALTRRWRAFRERNRCDTSFGCICTNYPAFTSVILQ